MKPGILERMNTFLFYMFGIPAKLQRFRSFICAVGILTALFWPGKSPWCADNRSTGIQLLAGLDFSSLVLDYSSGQSITRYDRKLGQAFGLELDLSLGSVIELATGINYRLRNYGQDTTVYSLSSLELPLLLRLYLGNVVALQAGVYGTKGLGFMTISHVPANSATAGYSNQLSYESMNLQEWDFGAIAGLRIVTDSPSRMALDLRYLVGFFNVQRLPNYQGTFSSFELLFSFPLIGK
jgi:hypothetical protein